MNLKMPILPQSLGVAEARTATRTTYAIFDFHQGSSHPFYAKCVLKGGECYASQRHDGGLRNTLSLVPGDPYRHRTRTIPARFFP